MLKCKQKGKERGDRRGAYAPTHQHSAPHREAVLVGLFVGVAQWHLSILDSFEQFGTDPSVLVREVSLFQR